MRDKDTGNTQE